VRGGKDSARERERWRGREREEEREGRSVWQEAYTWRCIRKRRVGMHPHASQGYVCSDTRGDVPVVRIKRHAL